MSRWIATLSATLLVLIAAGLPAAGFGEAPAAAKQREIVTVAPPVPLSATQRRQLAEKARIPAAATSAPSTGANGKPHDLRTIGPAATPLGERELAALRWLKEGKAIADLPLSRPGAGGEIRRASDPGGTRGAKGEDKRRIEPGPADPSAAELAKRSSPPAKDGPR